MSSSATVGRARSGLKADYLSFWEVVAQSVANIAPSATPAFILPLVFASSENGTWLAYVLATLSLLLVTYHINRFARRSASPGALYTFVTQGLGAGWGVLCGWALLIAYLFTGAATMAGMANYVLVLAHLGVSARFDLWIAIGAMLVAVVAFWWLAYSDVKLSARAMLWLEFVSLALIIFFSLVFLFRHPGVDRRQFSGAAFHLHGIARGLVLAIFSFVGFESATALGHEARNPLRSIPRSVLVTVLAVGALFVFLSYILVAAFRFSGVSLGESNAPLSVLAMVAGIPAFGTVIAVGIIISFFACEVASVNAGARVLFLMSRHGVVHRSAGDVHAAHATPHVAVTISSLLCVAVPVGMLLRGMALVDVFGYLGSLATFGFLLAYVLVSVAAPAFLRRLRMLRPRDVVAGVASLALLALPVVGSVYPWPEPPARYVPLVFVGLLVIGMAWFVFFRRRDPEISLDPEQQLLKE